MKQKVLLFDGLSIAHRAFYGIPLLTNKQGVHTNAVYGFLNIMLSIIEKEKPDLLGVAFDVSAPTFRHNLSKEYKGNRKGMPEELRPQIPLLKQVLSSLNICFIEKEGFEADDILGTLAKNAERNNYDVVIVSGDRDLFQVTSDTTQLKIPRTKKTGTEIESYYAKDVEAIYGVSPKEFIDVKGLMGDTSDNIKGVPGIGEKTALKLIKEYGSIENLLENVESITQKKLKENLMTYSQDALDSKKLATIVCDVPLDYKWEEFNYKLVLDDKSYELLRDLEFKSIINKLPKEDNIAPKSQNLNITLWDANLLRQFLVKAKDKESAMYSFMDDKLWGVAFCIDDEVGYIEIENENEELVSLLKQYMTSDYQKIVYDAKSLMHDMSKYNMFPENIVFDTLIATYLLYPTNTTYDVSEIEEIFLKETNCQNLESVLGKGKNIKKWSELEQKIRQTEMASRALTIYKASFVIKGLLEENEMHHLFYSIEMPLIEVLFSMEKEGILVDVEALKEYGRELEKTIDIITEDIYNEVGEKFNINSPKQLGVILFEKLKIPAIKKTKTGYSTAADVLEKLKNDYPVVEKILEYRQYMKLKSTYVEGIMQVLSKENKVHSTFNQTITATGRLSSTEPNLQNIPIRMELGRKIRKVFIPRSKEYVFLDADYSQIELRVLAHIAKDETLIEAFKNGIDIHALTASQVFHVPFEEVTSEQRSSAKAVNFGIVYGISAFSLADDLKISQKSAQKYIDSYFEKYPSIKKYLDEIVRFAQLYGHVETLFHRKREIPEIQSNNFNIREFGKRIAMNTPIQGTSADIIKIAMIKVYQALKKNNMKSKLILTVHDELIIETHKDEVDKVKEILKCEMEHAVSLDVPLEVDIHKGNNWFETK